MRSLRPLEFNHRMNANGSMDSICSRCYETIATSMWEAELELAESAHTCERQGLRIFEMTHKPPFRETWSPRKSLDKTA
ncbi:hypothetical protein [Occallatibacter savannae]|uniref:hypothetical protein n=1 Tax=Occallatibacter savannae TaxID=1002691 RepID=UPI000D68A88C|nr:hypothetical protein [Occallatibacter savannae]